MTQLKDDWIAELSISEKYLSSQVWLVDCLILPPAGNRISNLPPSAFVDRDQFS